MRRPAARHTGPPADTVDMVLARDDYTCRLCATRIGTGQRGVDFSLHHRRARGMGGTRRADTNSPANLVTVCGSGTAGCHGRIERQRAWAIGAGWLLPQSTPDPAAVPIRLDAVGGSAYLYLDDDGGATITQRCAGQ